MIKKIKQKENVEIFGILLFLFVILFVFLTKSQLHIWIGGDAGTDSSVFKTVALMMDKGYMPYRDTFDHKGPLIYFINWLGNRISVYRGIWIIEYLNLYISAVGMYKIARLKCGRFHSCVALLVSFSMLFPCFQGGNYTEEFALPLITASLYIFLDYLMNQKISRFRLAVCGFCLGGVCLLRVNMISLWIVFCGAIFIKCILEKSYPELGRFIAFFALGFCIIVIPFMLWLLANHALQGFWEDYIRFNMVYTSAAGGKALFSAKWESFFVFLNKPVLLFALAISAYMWRTRDKLVYGLYICYLFATLLLICISGMTYRHYGMILVPAAVFPIASLYGLTSEGLEGASGKAVALLATGYFLCVVVMPDWLSLAGDLGKIYSERGADHTSDVVSTVCKLAEENTSAEDKISVYGNWNIIYVRSNRIPATKYSYQYPIGDIMPAIYEEYWRELEEEMPKVIAVESGQYDTAMSDFITVHGYQLIWEENVENGAMVFLGK